MIPGNGRVQNVRMDKLGALEGESFAQQTSLRTAQHWGTSVQTRYVSARPAPPARHEKATVALPGNEDPFGGRGAREISGAATLQLVTRQNEFEPAVIGCQPIKPCLLAHETVETGLKRLRACHQAADNTPPAK